MLWWDVCEPTIQSTSLVAPRCMLYVHITESYACACTCTVFCNILLVCRFLDAAELPEAPAERDVSHSNSLTERQRCELSMNATLALPFDCTTQFNTKWKYTKHSKSVLSSTCTVSVNAWLFRMRCLLQVTDWLGCLLDAHFSQFILSQDVRAPLLELHQAVENRVSESE